MPFYIEVKKMLKQALSSLNDWYKQVLRIIPGKKAAEELFRIWHTILDKMDPVVLEVVLLCLGVFVIMKVVLKVQYYSHFQLFIFPPGLKWSSLA